MAAEANTNLTFSTIGIREDLADKIYLVAAEDTPFTSNIGTTSATNTFHEWQTHALASAVDTNAVLEGDDSTIDAATRTVRVGNRTQISDKTASVSGTNQAVDQAGRSSEMAFQLVTKGTELARDIEKQMLSNKASVAGDATTARQSAGMLAWLETNTERGAGGSDGGFSSGVVSAATNGTLRNFTETLLKAAQQSAFNNGGKPTQLYMDGALKQTFSGFGGISATRVNTTADANAQTSIVGAADVYVGDFGTLTAIPHPYGTTGRDVIGVDTSMVAKSILRPMASMELAKNGDAERRLMNEEYCLEVKNEAAHFVVADVQSA